MLTAAPFLIPVVSTPLTIAGRAGFGFQILPGNSERPGLVDANGSAGTPPLNSVGLRSGQYPLLVQGTSNGAPFTLTVTGPDWFYFAEGFSDLRISAPLAANVGCWQLVYGTTRLDAIHPAERFPYVNRLTWAPVYNSTTGNNPQDPGFNTNNRFVPLNNVTGHRTTLYEGSLEPATFTAGLLRYWYSFDGTVWGLSPIQYELTGLVSPFVTPDEVVSVPSGYFLPEAYDVETSVGGGSALVMVVETTIARAK